MLHIIVLFTLTNRCKSNNCFAILGRTATQAALVLARRMFEGNEDRPDAPNVVFLLTDGQPSDGLNNDLMKEASRFTDYNKLFYQLCNFNPFITCVDNMGVLLVQPYLIDNL